MWDSAFCLDYLFLPLYLSLAQEYQQNQHRMNARGLVNNGTWSTWKLGYYIHISRFTFPKKYQLGKLSSISSPTIKYFSCHLLDCVPIQYTSWCKTNNFLISNKIVFKLVKIIKSVKQSSMLVPNYRVLDGIKYIYGKLEDSITDFIGFCDLALVWSPF